MHGIHPRDVDWRLSQCLCTLCSSVRAALPRCGAEHRKKGVGAKACGGAARLAPSHLLLPSRGHARQCQLSASELLTAREQTLQENEKSFCLLGPGLCWFAVDAGDSVRNPELGNLAFTFCFRNNCVLQNVAGKAPSPTQALVTTR